MLKSGFPASYNIEAPPPPPLSLPQHSASCNRTTTCANRVFVQVGFGYHRATATITYIQPPLPQIYNYIAPPPATTTTGYKLDECKWSMCASGWKEKHHQRKLQLVMTTNVQVEFCPLCPLHAFMQVAIIAASGTPLGPGWSRSGQWWWWWL